MPWSSRNHLGALMRDFGGVCPRFYSLDDARDLVVDHGRGRVEARLGGALGFGGEHHDRMGADDPGVGAGGGAVVFGVEADCGGG